MDQHDLELEQSHLTEKLKQYNAFLNRLVSKHLTKKAVEDGKARGVRKGLYQKHSSEIQEAILISTQVNNAQKKEKQLKKELHDVEILFNRVMDPAAYDNLRNDVEYLDEMIK